MEKCGLDKIGRAFYPGLVMPPRADGSPLNSDQLVEAMVVMWNVDNIVWHLDK